ncbi:MAG: molybdate ABC transporter substrate-binding protein [Methylocystis sp.]
MKFKGILAIVIGICGALSAPGPAAAGQTNVAVAANFTRAAQEIATLFNLKTGHVAVMSFGATGQLYTQIMQSAPFEIFLAADEARPKKAVDEGLAAADSVFTYAIGKLVLWSRDPALVTGPETLDKAAFAKLAYCNPVGAPYGAAAVETLRALRLYDKLQSKLVQGESVSQAFQFVDTGNAELGFVALSQLVEIGGGSRWIVPPNLYTPIRQDAVLLKRGVDNPAAIGFMTFLKGPDARAIIEKYGYGVDAEHR